MTPHHFFNMLEDRCQMSEMKNGIWEYPADYIERYNAQRDIINSLLASCKEAIVQMTELEKEQVKYTACGNYKPD